MIKCKSVLVLATLFNFVVLSNVFSAEVNKPNSDNQISNKAILVLDASGSMWGQIDGKAKISIAREVITEIVNGWDPATPLGLLAYGHNKKSDCQDIELLQKPQKVNKKHFIDKINKLKPKGKTPLSAAVKEAAIALDYTHKKATVVLISDGRETCNLDPCEVGRLLKKQGFDFTAHVIGFDVPDIETAGLRCLAQETGGLFLQAKNASELKKAFNETSELITYNKPPKITPASVNVPIQVIAGAAFEAQWTGPKNKLDRLIIKSSNKKTSLDYEYIGQEDQLSPAVLNAPEKAGTYQVLYQLSNKRVLAKATLKVIPANASVSMKKQLAAGAEFQVKWSGPNNRFDLIGVFNDKGKQLPIYVYLPKGKKQSVVTLKSPEIPGRYEVRYYTFGKHTLAKQAFSVNAASASVSMKKQLAAGSEFQVKWSGPNNKFDLIGVFNDKGKQLPSYVYLPEGKKQSVVTLKSPEIPGRYEIRYYTFGKQTLAKQAFTVTAETASVSMKKQVVAGAEFQVKWSGPNNQFDLIGLFNDKAKQLPSYVYLPKGKKQSVVTLTAPEAPGRYEVRYYTFGKQTLAKQAFTITAASASVSMKKQVVAGAGFEVKWSGPNNKFDLIGVFNDKGKQLPNYVYLEKGKKQSVVTLTAPEAAGHYELRYYTFGRNTLAKFDFKVISKN